MLIKNKTLKYSDCIEGYSGTFTRTITAEGNKLFGKVVGDFSPVHFDEERMSKTRFGKIITNGFFTESAIGSALANMFTSDKTLVIALKKTMTLTAPVFIGDTITATVIVTKQIPEKKRLLCDCKVRKQDGSLVVDGEFLVKILEI
ncbi:MAG: MaoC family dehydratase [Candidatus Micrarchaeota archaeon]